MRLSSERRDAIVSEMLLRAEIEMLKQRVSYVEDKLRYFRRHERPKKITPNQKCFKPQHPSHQEDVQQRMQKLEMRFDQSEHRLRCVASDQANSAYCNASFSILCQVVRLLWPNPADRPELFFMLEAAEREMWAAEEAEKELMDASEDSSDDH